MSKNTNAAAKNTDETVVTVPNQTTTENVTTLQEDGKTVIVISDAEEKTSLVQKAKGLFGRNRKLVYAAAALSATALVVKIVRSRMALVEEDEAVETENTDAV